jgi:hypothetical protein
VNKPILQTQVTAMKKYDWNNHTDEDIKEDILFIFVCMNDLRERKMSEIHRQAIADEYLDKLNSLYDEQRKRSTFKGGIGTT